MHNNEMMRKDFFNYKFIVFYQSEGLLSSTTASEDLVLRAGELGRSLCGRFKMRIAAASSFFVARARRTRAPGVLLKTVLRL